MLSATERATPKVLFVDDEPAVLRGLERVLFDAGYDISSDTLPRRALGRLVSEGPFDVVVSDMRMPDMDGAAFLAAASQAAPDTMRVLLTGQADVAAAVAAVNEGHILHFLQKPCEARELSRVIDEAVRRRRAMLDERALLEETLAGAIRALSEMMQVLAPDIFHRSSSLSRAAAHVSARLAIEPRWAIEVAARLCQIGCAALPVELVERDRRGDALSREEQALLAAHPETGYRLLSHIPRLEGVAAMVRYQRAVDLPKDLPRPTAFGARVLRVLLDLDRRMIRGARFDEARATMRKSAGRDDAAILDALAGYAGEDAGPTERAVPLQKLNVGAILAEDVVAKNGAVIVGKGAEVTLIVRERLFNFAKSIGVREPICIKCPA